MHFWFPCYRTPTLAVDGSLRIERGYVRPEDEAQSEPVTPDEDGTEAEETGEAGADEDAGERPIGGGTVTPFRPSLEPEDKAPALSTALLAELQSHRTAGLQAAIAGQPELALRVMPHGLATDAFYQRYGETVAGFHSYPPALASACPGVADSPARQAMTAAEDAWRTRLPQEHGALWGMAAG
jgi:ParB family chromosome partitioning protein